MLPEISQAKAAALQFLVERMADVIDSNTNSETGAFYPRSVFQKVGPWLKDAREVLATS